MKGAGRYNVCTERILAYLPITKPSTITIPFLHSSMCTNISFQPLLRVLPKVGSNGTFLSLTFSQLAKLLVHLVLNSIGNVSQLWRYCFFNLQLDLVHVISHFYLNQQISVTMESGVYYWVTTWNSRKLFLQFEALG